MLLTGRRASGRVDKVYNCPVCGCLSDRLKRHMLSNHSGELTPEEIDQKCTALYGRRPPRRKAPVGPVVRRDEQFNYPVFCLLYETVVRNALGKA